MGGEKHNRVVRRQDRDGTPHIFAHCDILYFLATVLLPIGEYVCVSVMHRTRVFTDAQTGTSANNFFPFNTTQHKKYLTENV